VLGGFAFGGFLFNADPGMRSALGEITETIRSGRPPLIDRYGSVCEYLATQPTAAAGLTDDGRLLLVEAIIPDDDSPHLSKDLDIRAMTILPGGGRTESEYARLLAEGGFRPQPAAGLARVESVMVAVPAGS